MNIVGMSIFIVDTGSFQPVPYQSRYVAAVSLPYVGRTFEAGSTIESDAIPVSKPGIFVVAPKADTAGVLALQFLYHPNCGH
jgi:hypothetical protein